MRIKPSDNWRWYYNGEHDRTMLDLANGMLFHLRSARRMFTLDTFSPSGFRVDNTALYSSFEEKCRYLDLAKEQKAELVLNASVTIRYLKSQMPRSWHFVAHGINWSPIVGNVACAGLSDIDEQVDPSMVESGGNAMLCLLIQPDIATVGRTMQLGDATKMINDGLKPQIVVDSFSLEQAVQLSSLIIVLGTRLQYRIAPSSLITDFFNGPTSSSTSRIQQHPQMPARHGQGTRIPQFSNCSGNTC